MVLIKITVYRHISSDKSHKLNMVIFFTYLRQFLLENWSSHADAEVPMILALALFIRSSTGSPSLTRIFFWVSWNCLSKLDLISWMDCSRLYLAVSEPSPETSWKTIIGTPSKSPINLKTRIKAILTSVGCYQKQLNYSSEGKIFKGRFSELD